MSVICITKRWVDYSVDVRLGTVSGGEIAVCEAASARGLLSLPAWAPVLSGVALQSLSYFTHAFTLGGGQNCPAPGAALSPVGASI
jgi:hypothetical protein